MPLIPVFEKLSPEDCEFEATKENTRAQFLALQLLICLTGRSLSYPMYDRKLSLNPDLSAKHPIPGL